MGSAIGQRLDTPLTLLERLRGPGDEAAWGRFVELYGPLLLAWARRCGEKEHDAADLVQEVFVTLVQALPSFQYDARASFHRWLRTILLNKVRDRQRRRLKASKALGQRGLEDDVPDVAEQLSEEEYRREVATRALELMQAEFGATTWKACWETIVHDRPVPEVARELGMTENAVYIARCRVLRRLRQELGGLLD